MHKINKSNLSEPIKIRQQSDAQYQLQKVMQ